MYRDTKMEADDTTKLTEKRQCEVQK